MRRQLTTVHLHPNNAINIIYNKYIHIYHIETTMNSQNVVYWPEQGYRNWPQNTGK